MSGELESYLRGLDLNTPTMPRNFIDWSCKLILFRESEMVVVGNPRKVRGESTKQ